MPKLIEKPTIIEAAGNKPKKIEEFAGRVNSGQDNVSVARMTSPQGWIEPGQRPEFEELTVVLEGTLVVEHEGGRIEVSSGQAVITHPGEWIKYSTPNEGGAKYIAVCRLRRGREIPGRTPAPERGNPAHWRARHWPRSRAGTRQHGGPWRRKSA